jgi:hypothetical protein
MHIDSGISKTRPRVAEFCDACLAFTFQANWRWLLACS